MGDILGCPSFNWNSIDIDILLIDWLIAEILLLPSPAIIETKFDDMSVNLE